MNPKLITIGDLNADFLATVKSLPEKGEEIQTNTFEIYAGGSAANTAVTAQRLNLESGFIGRVGKDYFGNFLEEEFEREGVVTKEVQRDEEKGTGAMMIIVTPDGERTMICRRGANTELDPEKINLDYVGNADYLHVSGYTLLKNPQSKAAKKVIEAAETENLHISLDTGIITLKEARENTMSILSSINTLFVNEVEIELLLETESGEKSEKDILDKGPSNLVIKLGDKGSRVVTEDEEFQIDSFQTEVKGTTGAGDAFDGGFIVGLDKGWNLKKTTKFANAVGTLSGLEFGARTSLPTFRKVRSFLKEKGVEI